MGKILNTTYHDTVKSITGFYSDLVNNPFYTFNDKKPVICTYYNINKDFSSLDPGSKLYMDNIGKESPIRYNRIYDFIIYGFQRVELNTESSEFGVEASNVEGECYILPNTIIPIEGDYFEVEHIKDSTWLFIVKDVQKDTLENGSNVYKISYKLEYTDHNEILSRIVHDFRLIEKREGTNIASVVRCEDYDTAKLMDEKAVMLKDYFQELFYSDKVQTFIYVDITEIRVYDPYMIEFLIRNKILEDSPDSYIHVTHQIPVHKTFNIEYDKTFYRAFENKDKNKLLRSDRFANIEDIKGYGTIFSSRFEDYYKATYDKRPGYNTCCFKDNLIESIMSNKLVEQDSEIKVPLWDNIIIKYFSGESLTLEELNSIDDIEFEYSVDLYYIIPLLIFCLEKGIENILK